MIVRVPDSLLFDVEENRVRIAIVDEKRKLLYVDEQSKESKRKKSGIYLGKVVRFAKQINAVFVDIDMPGHTQDSKPRHGFLAYDEIAPVYYSQPWDESQGPADVSQLIKVGQRILVQVKKDQQDHGSKGDALTTFITLPGTYLVYSPYTDRHAVSRKADAAQKLRMKEIMDQLNVDEGQGLIVRTVGLDRSIEDLQHDFTNLKQQWRLIQDRWQKAKEPTLIYEEENLIIRGLRDQLSTHVKKIIVNKQSAYEFVADYLTATRPTMPIADMLELYQHSKPLYEHYGIENQIEDIFSISHQLPSGGHLVIQGTEAGVMIDVNSSKSVAGSNIDETALSTNLEAADKAADLLRLRDMSGIIYIDFIDMKEPDHIKKVQDRFEAAIQCDKARIKYEAISELSGCMTILRQSMGYPFFKSSLESIPHDESIIFGKRRSAASYAYHVLRQISSAAECETDVIQVQVPVDVSTYILNELRQRINEIELLHQVSIIIIPNEHYKIHKCVLKRFRSEDLAEDSKSYSQISPTDQLKSWASVDPRKPAIPKESVLTRRHKQDDHGFLKSMWQALFGSTSQSDDDKTATSHNNRSHHNNRKHNSRRTHRRPSEDRVQKKERERRSPSQTTRKPQNDQEETSKQPKSSIIEKPQYGVSGSNRQRSRRTNRSRQPNNNQIDTDSDLMKQIHDD